MNGHVYKVVDIVGSSDKSIEDAIQSAVERASQTIDNLKWFEVAEVRGDIKNGKIDFYQVVLRIGFTLK